MIAFLLIGIYLTASIGSEIAQSRARKRRTREIMREFRAALHRQFGDTLAVTPCEAPEGTGAEVTA